MNIAFITLQPSHVTRFTFRRRAQTLNFSINEYILLYLSAGSCSREWIIS